MNADGQTIGERKGNATTACLNRRFQICLNSKNTGDLEELLKYIILSSQALKIIIERVFFLNDGQELLRIMQGACNSPEKVLAPLL